jgi:L,D-transpeptidase ErfK/SrfK
MIRFLLSLRLSLLVFLNLGSPTAGQDLPWLSSGLVGGEFEYKAQRRDSLTGIGARFGVERSVLARNNNLDPAARLKLGQVLLVDNRHIVPQTLKDGILINLPQRMLFNFVQGKLASHYPVGLGRRDWPTPTGRFVIISKEENPIWDVPKTIQEEMRREGKVVKTKVPPCPENPLGIYWMALSIAGYGIHGTIAPASIYQFQTHGCVRLHPDDISELFRRVSIGTPGEIVYEPVLLAKLDGDRIYLEVHNDVYRKGGNFLKNVQNFVSNYGLSSAVDWRKAEQVVRKKEGLARDISKKFPGSQKVRKVK